MSKKKRSKIMAALLCATTMAAFYTAPQVVFAESLNVDDNGALTTNTNGTKPITNVTGLATITFGVDGEGVTESSVTLAFDINKQGLYADGAITADDLYLNVADNYAERYTLKNVLGVHRVQDEDGYITNIETSPSGQGGMQVSSNAVSIFGGKAVFDNREGGTISFNMAFDAAEGMTVAGDAYSVDTSGNIITKGTINSMTIEDNKVNGVTLYDNKVTANEVTAGTGQNTYSLTTVGSDVKNIADKTSGILSYDSTHEVTTFTGTIEADNVEVEAIEVDTITSGTTNIDVRDAADTLALVNDKDEGLAATYDIADKNKQDIANLNTTVKEQGENITALDTKVSGFDARITQNSTDIATNKTAIENLGTRVGAAETEIDGLQTVTTGMSYKDSTGTTFAKDVTATDFKIGNTSLNAVAQAVNNETTGLTKTYEIASKNQTDIATLNTTVGEHTNKISSLDTRN